MKKRILAMILCVLMILPCFAWTITASNDGLPAEDERINIAPNGKTYHSSVWNADGSARFLNNGILYSSWQFWRPGSVERPDTPGIDDTLQYAGMKFNTYYTFNEVTIYAHKYADTDGAFCGKCYTLTDDKCGCDGYLTNAQIDGVQKKDSVYYVYTYKNASGTKLNAYYDADSEKYYKDNRGREEITLGEMNELTKVIDHYICKHCGTKVLTYTNQRNNIKFTVKVLVQGKWIEAGHGYNNDSVYVVQGEDKNYQVLGEDVAKLVIKLDKVLPA